MPDNPFSALLNPDKTGTLTGFVGGLMGNPTASQAAGSATGTALQELAALKQGGLDNQQALLKFFQTPSGHDYFSNAGPDGLKQLAEGLQQMTPPAPVLNNVAPGGKLFATTPGGGTTQVGDNPQQFPNQVLGPQDMQFNGKGEKLAENTNVKGDVPSDVRSFTYFADLAKIPTAERQRLAQQKLDPTKTSVESEAIDQLAEKYGLDPRTQQALKAGTIKLVPMKNNQGQDTGAQVLIDISNPNGGAQIINPSNVPIPGRAGGTAMPGTTAETGAAVGVLPATQQPQPMSGSPGEVMAPVAPGPTGRSNQSSKTLGNKGFGTIDNMALGASPVSKVLGAATKITEAVSPSLIIDQGAQANDRQTLLDTLRSNLQAIGTIGGGLSSNKTLIEGYVKTFLDQDFFGASPHSQVSKLIRLSETADKNIADETARANDASQPHEVQKQAYETVAAWQRVKQSMPSYDTLLQQEKAIRDGTAGAPTIAGAGKALIDAGGKALTEGKKQATEVAREAGVGKSVDIDSINDPAALVAIDPRTLNIDQKRKLIYKLGKLKSGRGVQ